MWQGLVRNWLMGAARQRMRETATQAAGAAAEQAQTAQPQNPPGPPPRPVCHVGLVFALGIETGGLVDRLAGAIMTEGSGFVAREGGLHGRRLVLIESGAGRPAAARATEALIQGHRPQWVVSAGFAGALDERLHQGDIVMADQIVDTADRLLDIDFKLDRESLAATKHLHVGRLLTADRIIRDPQEKRALGQRHAALAVDMESMAVAEVCRNEKVRFLAVRVISDTVDRALPQDIDNLVKQKSTAGRLGAAAGALLRRPASIKDMWQLKEDALVASERLANFLSGVVGQLR
jgi:adenosylhomocysteine nucleosidase